LPDASGAVSAGGTPAAAGAGFSAAGFDGPDAGVAGFAGAGFCVDSVAGGGASGGPATRWAWRTVRLREAVTTAAHAARREVAIILIVCPNSRRAVTGRPR
jgi:hypothetical protein